MHDRNVKTRMPKALATALVAALSAFVLSAAAQPASSRAGSGPDRPLARVEALAVPAATPGAAVSLRVKVTPRKGIHIYAPPQELYKPVALTVDPAAGVRAGAPRFPASTTRVFEGETVRVYDREFTIQVPATIDRGARGLVRVTGLVTYQACDDLICYLPIKVPVAWAIQLQ